MIVRYTMKRRKFLVSALLFLPSSWHLQADSMICDRCGNAIRGRYIEYKFDGKKIIVCLSCNKKLPHCAACKLPFHKNQLIAYKGEYLCRECMAKAKYCSICGQRIQGHYYKLENSEELYCARCYSRTPKCTVCKKPTPRHLLDPESGACPECLKKLPHCAACGKAITGNYYRYKHSDGVFCPSCHTKRPKCYACGVPVGDKYWKFQDGRTICEKCNNRAVFDEERIRKIMAETEQLIRRHLGLTIEIPYELHISELNSKSFIDAKAAKRGQNSNSPLFGGELGLYRRMNGNSEIFLLYGVPPEMLYETAAHEYAHAWQAEHCPTDQSLELREGFAQWVAAQILQIKGFQESLEKLQERNDHPYGTGYRRFQNIQQNLGRQKVIEYAQKALR